MIALPSFINSRIRRGDFQRRVHSGIRRDRFDSGAVAQRRTQDGERIEERISARVRRADLPAWRDFLRETNGGAGWFDYQVPGTNPVRTVRARIIGGDIRERVLDGAGENTLLQMRIEWRNAKRAWQPTFEYSSAGVKVLGVWGRGAYIDGNPGANQLAGGDDLAVSGDISVGDDGRIIAAGASSHLTWTIPPIASGAYFVLVTRKSPIVGSVFWLDANNRLYRDGDNLKLRVGGTDRITAPLIGDTVAFAFRRWNNGTFFRIVAGGGGAVTGYINVEWLNGSYTPMRILYHAGGGKTTCSGLAASMFNYVPSNELFQIVAAANTSQSVFGLAEWSDS